MKEDMLDFQKREKIPPIVLFILPFHNDTAGSVSML